MNSKKKKLKKDIPRPVSNIDFKSLIDHKRRETDLTSYFPYINVSDPQDKAIEQSLKNGMLPVFAVDIYGANKGYVACSYGKMMTLLTTKNSQRKNHFYEVTRPIPSKLFIDVDIDLRYNPNVDFEPIQEDFFRYTREFFQIKKLINSDEDLKITVLDSSHSEKISRHYIFHIEGKRKFFRNPYHCGSFIRQLQNFIFEKKEGITDPTKSRFWFNLKGPNNQGDYGHFICDLGIYTLNRVFRTIFSEKLPDPDPNKRRPTPMLLPWKVKEKQQVKDTDFSKYFAQWGISMNEDEIIDFPEIDGSEPQSTSNVALFRIDKINRGIIVKSTELSLFYRRNHFPFETIWKLFGNENRQFKFEFYDFKSKDKETNFSKLTKFKSLDTFRNFIQERVPAAIHVGSVLVENGLEISETRELVIDVDKSDYPFLNCCGKDDPLCEKCFDVVKLALLISRSYFNDILGYRNVRFFFSGKKGFHGWVFDDEVKNLSEESQRKIYEPLLNPSMTFFIKYLNSLYSIKSLLEKIRKTFRPPEGTSNLLEYFWIRIDPKVSFSLKHVVKCPWTIHKLTRYQSFEIVDIDGFSFSDIKK